VLGDNEIRTAGSLRIRAFEGRRSVEESLGWSAGIRRTKLPRNGVTGNWQIRSEHQAKDRSTLPDRSRAITGRAPAVVNRRVADYTSEWMSYRRQVVRHARRSRRSGSRSEFSSFIRSNDAAVRQRQPVAFIVPEFPIAGRAPSWHRAKEQQGSERFRMQVKGSDRCSVSPERRDGRQLSRPNLEGCIQRRARSRYPLSRRLEIASV
jgi:hypothetical protein